MKALSFCGALALSIGTAFPAFATDPSWPDLRHALYGDQLLVQSDTVIDISAPYRTDNDARTDISANVTVPAGKMIETISVILDENPMPVSAVFDFADPVPSFSFDMTVRVNGPTPLHVVAKTTDGQHFLSEVFVKTSGSGACAAPPGTDPELALATLGNMQLDVAHVDPLVSLASFKAKALTADKMVNLAIDHPSHSGLQMDQISLLFIPARFIDTIDVDLDGRDFVEITGSISLSENPQLGFSVPTATQRVEVTLTDTDGSVSTLQKVLAGL